MLLGTSNVGTVNSNWDNKITVNASDYIGKTLTYSCIMDITGSSQGNIFPRMYVLDTNGNQIGNATTGTPTINFGTKGKTSVSMLIPSGASSLILEERTNNTSVNPTVSCRMLEEGTIPTDWAPAPEDKVNVSDMRKPASDVAGIEEVNAKQDKIGYTPADDSKVAHLSGANNFDTVPTYGNNEIPLALNNSGSTTNRPTGQVVGYQYFDTTLNKPIWYNGSNWVDSTGATV